MTGHIPPDDLASTMVRYHLQVARTDVGDSATTNLVAVGQEIADALRCRVLAWCTDTDDAEWLVGSVWRLADALAGLLERAGADRG